MAQLTTRKLKARFFLSVLEFALSFTIIGIVAVTQTYSSGERPSPVGKSNAYCALNHDAMGVCVYVYFLGGIGIIIALTSFWYTFAAAMTNMETPIVVRGRLNLFAVIWWFVGSLVLIVFAARVNVLSSRPPPASQIWVQRLYQIENVARKSVLAIAIVCTIM